MRLLNKLADVADDIGRSLGPFVSSQILELIQDQMLRLANDDSGGLLTFGVAATVSGLDITVVGWTLMAVGAPGRILTMVVLAPRRD